MYKESINCVCVVLAILFVGWLTSCNVSEASNGESKAPSSAKEEVRIVSIGGFITELLFELDYGDRIVGVDVTSTYPAQVKDIPNLGHVTNLNIEEILQLQPDIILAEDTPQAKATLQKLKDAGLKLMLIPVRTQLDNAYLAAEQMKTVLDIQEEQLSALKTRIHSDSLRLAEVTKQVSNRPSVLFLYARGTGRLLVAGKGTTADAVIDLAGGKNAISSFEGFKALSPEYLLEAAPEVVLMFESGLESLDGVEGLAQLPGMSQTPAFKNDRVITMDGHYLLSFGPRAGQAVHDLAVQLHTLQP